jgi:hypothetical protein
MWERDRERGQSIILFSGTICHDRLENTLDIGKNFAIPYV